jgi:hypothetical protein
MLWLEELVISLAVFYETALPCLSPHHPHHIKKEKYQL